MIFSRTLIKTIKLPCYTTVKRNISNIKNTIVDKYKSGLSRDTKNTLYNLHIGTGITCGILGGLFGIYISINRKNSNVIIDSANGMLFVVIGGSIGILSPILFPIIIISMSCEYVKELQIAKHKKRVTNSETLE